MKNVSMEVTNDDILVISVDLKQSFGPSKSGKNEIIASTEGNQGLPDSRGDIKIGLNIYRTKQGGADW